MRNGVSRPPESSDPLGGRKTTPLFDKRESNGECQTVDVSGRDLRISDLMASSLPSKWKSRLSLTLR